MAEVFITRRGTIKEEGYCTFLYKPTEQYKIIIPLSQIGFTPKKLVASHISRPGGDYQSTTTKLYWDDTMTVCSAMQGYYTNSDSDNFPIVIDSENITIHDDNEYFPSSHFDGEYVFAVFKEK